MYKNNIWYDTLLYKYVPIRDRYPSVLEYRIMTDENII